MRRSALAALALAPVLALPASAAPGSSGPFVGRLVQGQVATHHFDNNPSGTPCVDLTANYTITLHYAPTSDTLTLSAVTKTVAGTNGTASITVTQGVCAAFPVTVTGTSVAGTATYVVTVTRQLLPPITR